MDKMLNKKGLKQTGGNTPQSELAIAVSEYLRQGAAPEQLVMELLGNEISEEDIQTAFVELGYMQEDVQNLITAAKEYMTPTAQMGGDGFMRDPRANYMPMGYNQKGDIVSAAMNMAFTINDIFKPKAQFGFEKRQDYLMNLLAPPPEQSYLLNKPNLDIERGMISPKITVPPYTYSGRDNLIDQMTPESVRSFINTGSTDINTGSTEYEDYKESDYTPPKKQSKVLKAYGDVSNLAVSGARLANEFFKERDRIKAEQSLTDLTQADKWFGYFQDPVGKRGTYDINTGLLEQDAYVPYMQTAQTGIELPTINKFTYMPAVRAYNQQLRDQAAITPELLLRQAFKESTFNPKAESDAGYEGLTQLGSAVIEDYKKATGVRNVDPFNVDDAKAVQEWYMNRLYNMPFIDKPDQADSVRTAKALAAYNWGPGNFKNYLTRQKAAGTDIYNSWDWMQGLPRETSDYINKIYRGVVPDFEEKFQKGVIENPNIVDMYRYKVGGDFKPHMMYDPKSGKAYKANKPEDHERMAKMGYTHELPKAQRGWFDDVYDAVYDATDSGLRSVGNTLNSWGGGDPNYWDDRSRTLASETQKVIADEIVAPEFRDWVMGREGYIPDALTFGKPTGRQLETAGAILTSPKNWVVSENDIEPLPNYNEYNSFNEAFAKARKDLGRGQSFLYGGKRYTTNYKDEAPNNETEEILKYVTEDLSPEEAKRYREVWQNAGQPPIAYGPDDEKYSFGVFDAGWLDIASSRDRRRPHVNLLNRDNKIWLTGQGSPEYVTRIRKYVRDLLLEELGHVYQIRKDGTGTSFSRFLGEGLKQNVNLFGYDPYNDLDAFEGEAHEVIAPILNDYVYKGGNFPVFEPYKPQAFPNKTYKYGAELPKAMFGMPKVGLPGMNIMSWAPTGAGGNINKYIQRVKEDPVSFARFMNGDMSQVGKFIRFSEQGGELEVDNNTLAALIAAGADIEIL